MYALYCGQNVISVRHCFRTPLLCTGAKLAASRACASANGAIESPHVTTQPRRSPTLQRIYDVAATMKQLTASVCGKHSWAMLACVCIHDACSLWRVCSNIYGASQHYLAFIVLLAFVLGLRSFPFSARLISYYHTPAKYTCCADAVLLKMLLLLCMLYCLKCCCYANANADAVVVLSA